MFRVTRAQPFILSLVLLSVFPTLALAGSYGDGDLSEVGVAIFPFEVEDSDDRSLSFALEAAVQRDLPGTIGQPVFTGRETNRALSVPIGECVSDRFCVRLFGSQFGSSIAVRVKVFRVGSEVQVETEWFTTGNGLRVGRENTSFAEGDSDSLVQSFAGWWAIYWDTSLRVQPDSRAKEGGVVDDSRGSGGDWHSKEKKELKERQESGGTRRRQDFNSSAETDLLFDRNDPTADLREIVAGREGERRNNRRNEVDGGRDSSSRRADRSRADGRAADRDRQANRTFGRDDDLGRSSRADTPQSGRRETSRASAGASAPRSGGGQSASTSDFSKRETRRFEKSGLSATDYQDRRYALKKRFYLRTGGFYAGGYLMRRYFVLAYVRAGGLKTEEYGWESLGAMPATGGGMLGVGFAPVDAFAVEVDLGMMGAQQSLRWEYEGSDIGTNSTDNSGAGPDAEDQGVMHVALDIRARGFVFPKRRFKLTPGFGVTMLIMTGFKITPTPPLNFSSRPDTVVVGVTPVFGFNYAITPFLAFFGDFSATIYVTQSHADDEFHDFVDEGAISEFTPQFLEPRIQSRPIMARASFGVMMNF